MAFKVLFLAHAPDAVKEIHQNQIDTGMYQLFTVVVKNQAEAVEVCQDFVKNKNIDIPVATYMPLRLKLSDVWAWIIKKDHIIKGS